MFSFPQVSPQTAVRDILAGSKWGGPVGTGASLSYSWSSPQSNYSYSLDGADAALVALTPAQLQGALGAMQSAARVANLWFTAAEDTAGAAGDLRWAASVSGHFARTSASAYAYHPGSDPHAGDIWIDASLSLLQTATPGSFGFHDLLHELGHALGLSHPGEQGTSIDQLKYTVTSYRNFAGDGVHYLAHYYPTTFMLNDVAALQFLYGANTSANAGNTTYTWDPARPVYETIWDAGGFDTIDASNQASGVRIDLNAGTWSEIGPAFWNGRYAAGGKADFSQVVRDCLAIAYNCSIEAAIGSAYADTLMGNEAANVLKGGGGNDLLVGGGGVDTAVFSGALSTYRITQSGADRVISGADGVDTLRADVERAQFHDVAIAFDGEGAAGEVFRLYQAAFKREADAAGVGHWLAAIDGGASLVQVARAFIASREFESLYGDAPHAQFVTRLYQNALGREASGAEIAFHVDAVKTTSREQLLVNFSESPENRVRNILDADGPAAQIYRLYDTVLNRAPDTGGLLYHERSVDQGLALHAIAQQFMASPEFQALYGSVSDASFVGLLYANVLGRAPDAAGLAYQLDALRGGTSRAQLVVNFSESPEHRADAEFIGVIRDWVAYVPG